MPKTDPTPQHPVSPVCEHDYQLDRDLQMWVCMKCGSALELTTQVTRHECGSDCDRHGDISAIG